MGDNDDLDHRFLLVLWTCGEMFAKADTAVDLAIHGRHLRPIRLLRPKHPNGNSTEKEKVEDGRMERALIETLQRKSGTGKHVRVLLPKCPERASTLVWLLLVSIADQYRVGKARARTYGPST